MAPKIAFKMAPRCMPMYKLEVIRQGDKFGDMRYRTLVRARRLIKNLRPFSETSEKSADLKCPQIFKFHSYSYSYSHIKMTYFKSKSVNMNTNMNKNRKSETTFGL